MILNCPGGGRQSNKQEYKRKEKTNEEETRRATNLHGGHGVCLLPWTVSNHQSIKCVGEVIKLFLATLSSLLETLSWHRKRLMTFLFRWQMKQN
jgi:hypothetical protein